MGGSVVLEIKFKNLVLKIMSHMLALKNEGR